MRLPKQAPPVQRNVSTARYNAERVAAADIVCDICLAGCDLLSGFAKTLCQAACQATVC
jgi:hypothetical protein